MITYQLTPGDIKTFAAPDKSFLSFNEFVNIAQWFRDVHWAPENVPGFSDDIGRAYNVWTRYSTSTYHRHIFPDELADPVTISFTIPDLSKNATFPIMIMIFDDHGLYFEHEQTVAMERFVDNRFVLTGWKRIPKVRKFLQAQNTAYQSDSKAA